MVPPTTGVETKYVYKQNLPHFSTIVKMVFNQQEFTKNLHDQINKCKKKGYQVIIMVYINGYVHRKIIHNFFDNLGISELLLYRNRLNGLYITIKNQQSQPIDGIWWYQGIFISVVGYLTYNHGPNSDCILLRVKISQTGDFSDKNLPFRYLSISKLRLHHLCIKE